LRTVRVHEQVGAQAFDTIDATLSVAGSPPSAGSAAS
jgi:hypothetical protein